MRPGPLVRTMSTTSTKPKSIFDIEADWLETANLLESIETDDTLTDEQRAAAIEALEANLERLLAAEASKIDNWCRFIRNADARAKLIRAEAKAYKEEMDRYSKEAKAEEGKAARLKAFAAKLMLARGQTAMHGEAFKIRLQDNSAPSVVYIYEGRDMTREEFMLVVRPEDLPERFTKRVLDPHAVEEALIHGEKVEFARRERGVHVRLS